MANYIKGIDISKYQPGMDWARVRAQDIRFAFIKATQGESHVDPSFQAHWTGAKQAGILRGAYHFMDPDMDGRRQAENFLRTVHLEPGDLPPVLDVETLPAAALAPEGGKKGVKGAGSKVGKGTKGTKGKATDQINAQIVSCAEVWLRLVTESTGRKPLIYSRGDFMTTRMSINGKPPSWASRHPVWIANYLNLPVRENAIPVEAGGWPGFTFWQYSKEGQLEGVYDDVERTKPTVVDLDFFRGSLEQLYQFAGAPLPAVAESGAPQPGEEVQVAVPPAAPIPAATMASTYCIEAGDTLFGLATRFHTTVEALLAANPQVTNPDLIRIGDILNLPPA